MNIAQRLYEGLELGDRGTTALITYMRTDSVRIADEAQTSAGVAGGSGFLVVIEGLALILPHAVALGVQIADGAVGEGIALIGRFLEPAHG